MCDVEFIRLGHHTLVSLGSSDYKALTFTILSISIDKSLFRDCDCCGSIRDLGNGFRGFEAAFCDDDILAARQRATYRKPSPVAHDYGAAHGRATEIFHVCGDVPQKFIVTSDGSIVGNCRYDVLLHFRTLFGLYCDRGFDCRPRVIAFQTEILVFEIEDALHFRVQFHYRQRARLPGELKVHLFEVVQVYVAAPGKDMDKPARELRGYAKTKNLQPGESETVTIDIPYKNLASFNETDSQWQVEAGDYKVMVAKNAADLKPLTTVITEEAGVTEKVRPCLLKEVK